MTPPRPHTTGETLLDLLPALYRVRDTQVAQDQQLLTAAELGELALLEDAATLSPAEQDHLAGLRERAARGPLASLLAVIAEQVAVLEEDLDQLYDDQFIETASEWVAPYIGDLIGYRPLHGVVPRLTSARAEIANTVAYRRRKGTPHMLEQLARDVTAWPARVVEYFERLGWTQHMNHVRRDATYAPDLRQTQRLLWQGTAFDTTLHTVNVRRVERGGLPHNLSNIGIFLCRLAPYRLTHTPLVAAEVGDGRCFRLDALGRDLPLFTRPEVEQSITHLAEPVNLPLPIPLRWMARHRDQYYGPGRSVVLEVRTGDPEAPFAPVSGFEVTVCDLSDLVDAGGNVTGWAHVPPPGSKRIALDPEQGRVAFGDPPGEEVVATFHHGFSAPIGGGEYERGEASPLAGEVRTVADSAALAAEVAAGASGTVQLPDSGRYEAPATIAVAGGQTLVLRAVNGARPFLDATADVDLDLGPGATLVLDGLLLAGGALRLSDAGDDEPRTLVLRHCTLAPGRSGATPAAPALVVEDPFATVQLEASILGAVHMTERATVSVRDSILDATDEQGIAFRGPEDALASGGAVTLEGVTVIGRLHARELEATNVLFIARSVEGDGWPGPVWAERRQVGCVRFSFVPPGSRVPRRFQCHPDEADPPTLRPHLTSLRHGDPGYGQVAVSTADVIRGGADDEGEMGAFHLLHQPQREANLRIRLDEYLRYGLEAAVHYAT